jgi:hypothetical protein
MAAQPSVAEILGGEVEADALIAAFLAYIRIARIAVAMPRSISCEGGCRNKITTRCRRKIRGRLPVPPGGCASRESRYELIELDWDALPYREVPDYLRTGDPSGFGHPLFHTIPQQARGVR